MTVEEALEREVAFYLTHDGQVNLWKFINAYGAARELKGHVAACEEYVFVEPTTVDPSQWIPCGQEDVYCDDAKDIQELGKIQENHDS